MRSTSTFTGRQNIDNHRLPTHGGRLHNCLIEGLRNVDVPNQHRVLAHASEKRCDRFEIHLNRFTGCFSRNFEESHSSFAALMPARITNQANSNQSTAKSKYSAPWRPQSSTLGKASVLRYLTKK